MVCEFFDGSSQYEQMNAESQDIGHWEEHYDEFAKIVLEQNKETTQAQKTHCGIPPWQIESLVWLMEISPDDFGTTDTFVLMGQPSEGVTAL